MFALSQWREEAEPLRKLFEMVEIARAVEDSMGERRGGDRKSKDKILPSDKSERTDVTAAKKAGFGNKETFRQAKKVVDNAEPELVDRVVFYRMLR